MAALTFAEGAARLLSFGFYIVAARLLTTGEFGVVRYTIALSLLAFGGLQVLVTGLLKELGAGRADPERAPAAIGTALAAAGVVLAGSLALCAVAGAAGVTGSADLLGLLVCLAGLSVFQLYYAAARGLGDPRRAVVAYAGGSLAQLAISAVALAIHPTVTTALLVFGLSSLLRHPGLRAVPAHTAAAALQRARHAPAARPQRAAAGGPGGIPRLAHRRSGVGRQGAGRAGAGPLRCRQDAVPGVHHPARGCGGRAAATRGRAQGGGPLRHRSAARVRSRGGAACRHARRRGRRDRLSIDRPRDCSSATRMARPGRRSWGCRSGMAAYAAFVGLTEGAVGWGRPGVYSAGIVVAAVTEVLALLSLSDEAGISAAAWASAGSMALGLGTVVLLLVLRPLRDDPRT